MPLPFWDRQSTQKLKNSKLDDTIGIYGIDKQMINAAVRDCQPISHNTPKTQNYSLSSLLLNTYDEKELDLSQPSIKGRQKTNKYMRKAWPT